MTRRFLFALAIVLALPAHAQNSGLRRLTDRDDLFGWEAVGRLRMGSGGLCTGTLIAPDQVLTAAHCVFDPSTGSRFEPEDLVFQAGFRDGKSVAERRVAQVATHPDYVGNMNVTPEMVRMDVALLRLEKPIPTSLADPFALHQGALNGAEISVASYGQGRTEAISRQRSCRILWRDGGLMAYDCELTSGSSGSAILAHNGRRGRILSVHSSGGTIDGRRIGYGMELTDIVDQLKRQLRRDAPRPQAGVRRLTVGSGRSGSGAKFVRPGGS